VRDLLMDNSTSFRSEQIKQLCEKWTVTRLFRTAYRASGNGIVERNHRTIKCMAERSGITPIEALFWYNITPRRSAEVSSAPYKSLFTYEWRHPEVNVLELNEPIGDNCDFNIGDAVCVKPPNCRCTSRWGRGSVTKINSKNNVEVNGMARHVLDLRKRKEGDKNIYED
jgi:hypothetical protein